MKAHPVTVARTLGAKIDRIAGRWVCLDMQGTDLFTLTFPTIERAALAWLHVWKPVKIESAPG